DAIPRGVSKVGDEKRATRGLAALTVRNGRVSFPLPASGLRTPSKGKLTPFHNRYRKLGNFRLPDQPDRTARHRIWITGICATSDDAETKSHGYRRGTCGPPACARA